MIILAFDSSVNACSVALWHNGDKIFAKTKEMPTGQAEALMPMIEEALIATKLAPNKIDAIATTIGPGSFTGIRISLAAAKALGLALEIPVIGVSTLEAFAKSFKFAGDYPYFGVVVETKRQDFYFQLFDAKALPVSEMVYQNAKDIDEGIAKAQIGSIPIVGDGVNRLWIENKPKNLFKIENYDINYPDVFKIAEIAKEKMNLKKDVNFLLEPLYLRPPDVCVAK